MPAKSKAQRQMMAIAEHHPEALYGRNRGVLNMSQSQLHDFAATKQKGLPRRKKKAGPNTESHQYDWRQHQGGRRKK